MAKDNKFECNTPFKIATHDGQFHCDEVFACALMAKFYPIRIEVERTRDPEIIAGCDMAVDVGEVFDTKLNKLDHHQVSYTGDKSSAGMTVDWLLVHGHITERMADQLRYKYVDEVDLIDNGKWTGFGTSLSKVVSTFNCVLPHDKAQGLQFKNAVHFIIEMLDREELRWGKMWEDWDIVEPILEKLSWTDEILELPKYLDWMGPVGKRKSITRVIWPSVDGEGKEEWCVRVPNRPVDTPFDLAPGTSLTEGDPAKHIDDVFFVHKSGFFGKASTYEGAIRLAKWKDRIEYASRRDMYMDNPITKEK